VTELTKQWVHAALPQRKEDGHKGDFGRVLAVCGAVGYTGAPVFASRAAVRSGAGLVFLAVPESIWPIVAMKSDEAMPFPVPEEDGKLSSSALSVLKERAAGCDAVLIGCGLGRSAGVDTVVRTLTEDVEMPLVLDADGINALAGHTDILKARRGRLTVLTPHEGEFLRIGGDLSRGREEAAADFARRHNCVLVLKGHRTLIAGPEGELYRNTTGNCGMAKGGSGDVLSGMILALLGQGMPAVDAAAAAVWLHGRVGDLCREEQGSFAMTPGDMVANLGRVFRTVE